MKRICLALAFSFLSVPALAATNTVPPQVSTAPPQSASSGNFYVGPSVGAVIPEDTGVSLSGSITGSGDIRYKTGFVVTGLAGYNLTDNFAAEAELGYSEFDYDNLSGTLTAGSLGSVSGTIGIDGSISAFLGMVNGLYSPLGKSGFSPYLGAGIGFANSETDVRSLSAGGTTATVNSKNSSTDLAVSGIFGLNFALSENVSIGGRYRYLWVNTADSVSSGGLTASQGDFTAHAVTAQATLRF